MITILQAAPESWLLNLPNTVGVAAILGGFCWYFINQLKQQADRHEAELKRERDEHKDEMQRVRDEQKQERLEFRARMDKVFESVSDLTKTAINAINVNTSKFDELQNVIKHGK